MQLFSQSDSSSKNAHYETHWRETTQMQTMRLHYNTFNLSEEPQKDPLSHYKTVRDGRRDVAAEALAHINLGTHLKIYNGKKVIQHLLFIQGKSHVSASVNSRTHKIAVSRRTCYWHSFTRISYRRYGQRASILGTLRKSDQSTISYTDYICSPPF